MQVNETGLAMMDAVIPLSGGVYDGGGLLAPLFNGVPWKCKGLYSTADVTIVVRCIRGGNVPCILKAGQQFGVAFDRVVEAGSGALTTVYAIPM